MHDQEVLKLGSGKTGILLAYLATESCRAHSRQTLAELFWPERSNIEALNSLRYALSNLRSVLKDRQVSQPVLLITRSQVQFNPQADVWIDVVEFQEQTVNCQAATINDDALSLSALQSALALYKGKFLQGCNLGDSLDIETWALNKREQLERLHLRLLQMLVSGLEAKGDFPQAEEACRNILAVQPWDENTHRKLMRLLASSGKYTVALAQYDACSQALSQLGIEPGRDTNLLYHHIKKVFAGLTQGGDFSLGSLHEERAISFVARERELDKLVGFLSRMLARQGQVALITGEAGSGKTALLNEFARQALAHHPDLLVVGGRCNAYAGLGQPYQPFVEIIQMLSGDWDLLPWFEHLPVEDQNRLGLITSSVAEILVRVAPDILDRFINRANLARRLQNQDTKQQAKPTWQKVISKVPTPSVALTRLETSILFEQVTRFLIEIAHQRPLVLLMDDLQWIDPGSAALLFHLVQHIANSRILILAAYRSGEINLPGKTGDHPLFGIVTELQRYAGNIRVDLDQVDEQAFVSSYLEKDPLLKPNKLDETFRTALALHTGGNPLFTIELLRSLQARGDLYLTRDGYWVSSPTLDWQHLPERVEAAIAGRVARLPIKWLEWLLTASVEGESFTAEALARVHKVEENELIKDLSGPLSMARIGHRLIRAEGTQWLGVEGQQNTQLSRYRFRHILFQTYLYQQLDPVERSRRHAAVGFALEELYAAQSDIRVSHAAELARHFDAGGLSEKAASYHLEAGHQAVYLASAQVAIAHYRRGLGLLANQPRTISRIQLEIRLYLALGVPFLSASGWGGSERQQAIQKALDLLKEARRVYRKHPAESDIPTAEWLTVIYAQADWLISQGELQKAAMLGEEMLTLAGKRASQPLALAHRILGASHLFQGNFLLARQHLEAAIDVNAAIGQPAPQWWPVGDLESTCRSTLGFVLAACGYPDQAWEQVSQALDRAHSLQRFSSLGSTLIFACEVAILRRDLTGLQILANELLQLGLVDADERRFFHAYGLAADGYVKVLQAEPGSEQALVGLELIRSGMELWESTGTRAGRGQWIVHVAAACLHARQIEAGLELVNTAITGDFSQWIGAGLARIHRLHGELSLMQKISDRDKAKDSFIKALEIAREQGAHSFELKAAISLVKLWQAERPTEARQLLEETCAWFTEGHETPDYQEAQALLRTIAQNLQ